MNERIKELENQCWEERAYGSSWFNAEKFAELIVKECARALEINAIVQRSVESVEMAHHAKSQDWMNGYNEGTREYGSFLLAKNANLLKKNFGIKE